MADMDSAEDPLIEELKALRAKLAILEHTEADRQRVWEALQTSETRYRRLFESAQDGILILDAETGQIVAVNPFLTALVGYSPEELLGKTLWEIGPFKDIAQSQAAFRELQTKGYVRYEDLPLETRDGRLIDVEFVSNVYLVDHSRVIQCNIRDITDRKQAEAALQDYRDRLEVLVAARTAELQAAHDRLLALTRLKDEFISSISHELRTPITSLKLYLHLLVARPDELDTYLAVLERETERLQRIVEDVLYLSSLDREKTTFKLTMVNLDRLVSQFVSDRKPLAQERGLEFSVGECVDLPLVQGDEGALGRVLGILLSNALSYTPAGGWVEVSTHLRDLSEDGLWVGFRVSDSGPGILPDELPRLFERFFRGRVSLSTGTPGSGLGLATAQEIVGRHQGRIEVESEGMPGRGATFSVWLPAAPS
jgi:PAS domain S-box-containing protein